jgi:type I restriction enzyme R subunit
MPSPEELARKKIDALLQQCGWIGDQTVKDWSSSDKTSSKGEARRVSACSANQFQQFVTPDDGRKFTELYNVQHLQSAQLDRVSRLCISTIQRLYSMLRGEEIDAEIDERSGYELGAGAFAGSQATSLTRPAGILPAAPLPVTYNPAIPIESFDFIITDECHRSIYNLWRQVLEYFDAYLIGLTATPSKQTIGFFNKNLVMEYSHERAVADQVIVNYDVYKIETGSRLSRRPSLLNARLTGHPLV